MTATDVRGADLHASTARFDIGEEAGLVAGAEALILGVLVFVFGTLVVLNGWAVVDAKFATGAASREAVRAVVESGAEVDASTRSLRARAAAEEAVAAHGYDSTAVNLEYLTATGRQRCEPVRIRAEIEVRSTIVPGLSGPTMFRVRSEHEEIIDPFRSGLAGSADCGF